jgi:hypothetical protein
MIFNFLPKNRYFSFGKPVYFNGYFDQFTGITSTGLPVLKSLVITEYKIL